MRYTILILTILSMFLVGCTATVSEEPETQQPDIETEEVIPKAASSIAVPDQLIEFDVVLVSNLVLEQPGFVLIQDQEQNIIGNSEIYLSGTYSNIGVKISEYEGAKELTASIVLDDGDNTFEYPSEDSLSAISTNFLIG